MSCIEVLNRRKPVPLYTKFSAHRRLKKNVYFGNLEEIKKRWRQSCAAAPYPTPFTDTIIDGNWMGHNGNNFKIKQI